LAVRFKLLLGAFLSKRASSMEKSRLRKASTSSSTTRVYLFTIRACYLQPLNFTIGVSQCSQGDGNYISLEGIREDRKEIRECVGNELV